MSTIDHRRLKYKLSKNTSIVAKVPNLSVPWHGHFEARSLHIKSDALACTVHVKEGGIVQEELNPTTKQIETGLLKIITLKQIKKYCSKSLCSDFLSDFEAQKEK